MKGRRMNFVGLEIAALEAQAAADSNAGPALPPREGMYPVEPSDPTVADIICLVTASTVPRCANCSCADFGPL